MTKYMRRLFICALLVSNLFVYEGYNIESHALEESNLDLLISNHQMEEELQAKIQALDESVESKVQQINNIEKGSIEDNEVEVVTLSFVDDNRDIEDKVSQTYTLNQEIVDLELEKEILEAKLQEYIIEEVKLQKAVESEKKEYIKVNNLEYIEGIWPVPLYTDISSPFGNRIHPITNEQNFHKGIDIPAPQYTEIVSSDDGIVIFSGEQNGYGNVVKIKHFDGKRTVYAHNTSNIVKEGDIIRKGEPIAQIGSTGDSTGNHVHFETIVNEKNINPIDAVK